MSDRDGPRPPEQGSVAQYKEIFRRVLETRPSGTRRRLAEALGTNPSFISQISSPVYSTPVPAQYIERVMDLCHFSPRDREEFLRAYRSAHPRKTTGEPGPLLARHLSLKVPDFGDSARNRAFDKALEGFAADIARVIAANQND